MRPLLFGIVGSKHCRIRMTISVSIHTMSGEQLLAATAFPGPTVSVAELRALVSQGRDRQTVELLLGERVLDDADDLTGPELPITAMIEVDYAATCIEKFEDLDLKENLLRGVYAYGFEQPSGIQKRAIRPLLDGRSVVVQAQSGTGKTAAYVMASLQLTDPTLAATQTVVLAPTRELACPIQKVAVALGEYLRVSTHSCIGGTSVRTDIDRLLETPQFVVGTPGRVGDLISRRHLRLDALKLFVLDELDEMMARGFRGMIFDTVELLPPDLQLAVFSATMPPDVLEEMKRFLRRPVHLRLKKEELSLEGVRQFYVAIEQEEYKLDTLEDLLTVLFEGRPSLQAVVYCNTRRKVEFLADELSKRNCTVSKAHAELDRNERERVISDFQSGLSKVLLSTDLVAPGDSVPVFPLVISYDLPSNMEHYLHRIGRSGAFYRKGIAINFVTSNDVRLLRDIEMFFHTQVEELPADIADMI